MKKRLPAILALVLAILMIGSAFAAIIPMAIAAEEKTFNTTTPSHLLDFSSDELYDTFANINKMTAELKDGYTTFTAEADDPHTYLAAPSCKVLDATYVAIRYRTTAKLSGELFCTRSDKSDIVSNNHAWRWNASGEWETIVISIKPWQNAKADALFSAFRIDPLQGGVKSGESIDIQYYAFFATEEEANGFNFDQYKAKLAYEEEQKKAEEEANKKTQWPDPTHQDMTTTAEDTAKGTLKYTPSEDGTTVTISYEVNGETISYTVPNNQNYLFGGYAATDDLNRELYSSADVGSYDPAKRTIGLFYFLWHGEHGDSGAFDLQKIIDQVGVDKAASTNCGLYGGVGQMHWFAEPLYGYYYANDAWVLRKHAELLTMANVDFLFFDVTNAVTYTHNALKLMECLHELNEQGFDAPQVVFYTNTNAPQTVRSIYNSVYKANKYPDTWFCLDGKPVIVAPYDANIDDFFTIKQNQWPNDPNFKENGWPWMDFEWPQRVFTDEKGRPHAINVSVAQHSGTVAFSDSSLYNNYTNRGRSFTNPDGYKSSESKFTRSLQKSYKAWQADQTLTNHGLNFQAQWDHALSTDAPLILVTGWNEWVAQRQDPSQRRQPSDHVWFVDTSSMEFSRDTEMMRGGYFDNYYIQLIYNIQKAKGTAPVIVQDSRKPINVTEGFDQWADVTVTYKDAEGDTVDRNAIGFGRTPYKNTSGRNDIVSAKVTSDTKNLYFYIQTKDDVTMYNTESSWMQIYLNVDRETTGWYGYDFIVNYQAKDHFTTTVAKYNGAEGAYGFAPVGDVSYRAKGNEMMIAVPLSMLGIEGYKEINVEFKIADSETTYDEMEDFYCDGDIAPLGRLNYIFQNYIPGVSQITYPEPETTPDTTPDTDPATTPDTDPDAATDAPTDGEATTGEDDGKGCVSVILTATVPAMVAVLGCAVILRKKRED